MLVIVSLLRDVTDVRAAVRGPNQPGHGDVAIQSRDVRQGQRAVDQVRHQVPAGRLCLLRPHPRLLSRRGQSCLGSLGALLPWRQWTKY